MASLFHEQLLRFLQEDVRKKKREEGWDERIDPELQIFCNELSRALRGLGPIPFEELIQRRQRLLETRPILTELQLLAAFPEHVILCNHLPPLRIVRGLPRVYLRENPSQSKIDSRFAHLPDVKRILAFKSICHLYDQIPVPPHVRLSLMGDPLLCSMAAKLIQRAFPHLEVLQGNHSGISLQFAGEKQEGSTWIQGIGCFDSHHMGLHFLDQGMMISDPLPSKKTENLFFLADLQSAMGTFVYLHALLKSLEEDPRDIEICLLHPHALIHYFEGRLNEGKPLLEKGYHVKSLLVEIHSSRACQELEETGKTVRIFCPDQELTFDQLQLSLSQSEDFVACGRDLVLCEAISQNKIFFPDFFGEREFLKDLIALAEHYSMDDSVRELIRAFLNLCMVQQSDEKWVDELEVSYEKPTNLLAMAESIGVQLRHPTIQKEFQKLCSTLKRDYSMNRWIFQLIRRMVFHERHPQLARKEEELLDQFLQGRISFSQLISQTREAITLSM